MSPETISISCSRKHQPPPISPSERVHYRRELARAEAPVLEAQALGRGDLAVQREAQTGKIFRRDARQLELEVAAVRHLQQTDVASLASSDVEEARLRSRSARRG